MKELEKLEKRWLELVNKPKTKEEIEEILLLANKIELERAKESRDLIDELSNVGIKINSIWDLVNTKNSYPKAIDILINHLSKSYSEKTKEGIIRSLAVKEAKGKASPALIDIYNKTSKDETTLRWIIGNTVCITITTNDAKQILEIVKDKSNGISRQMFVLALGKIEHTKDSEDTLIMLLDDEDVCLQALEALARLKSVKAKSKILTLVNHPISIIKKEAQKALKKIR